MAGKAEYKNKWQKENCDRVNLTMPKGRKAEIQAHAEAQGQSVNGFINAAIDEKIEKTSQQAVEAPNLNERDGDSILTPFTLKVAQEAAESAGETIPQFVERAVETQAKRDKTCLAMGINPATGGKLEKEA